ncbi:MAG: hypothetical protein KDN19_09625 [Verrucomicrobiae bacterium]|nr:hypothetical protein [Verrucomicrobiae bacterium]
MKIAAFFFLIVTGVFLSSCASDFDPNAGADYADPDPLRTQGRIQQMHSDAMRQQF